jgi:enoyl-CoA hydratase/carnithine racemase
MPRYIGLGRTLAFANQGETIDAEQALELGLITGIIDDGQELAQVCVEYIQTLSSHHREILQSNRQSILPSAGDISTALDEYYASMAKVITSRRARTQS